MTKLLIRLFIREHENIEDAGVRTSYSLLGTIVGICCNLLLFVSKLVIGMLANSISVMADAFNNLSDVASSIIGFIGVKMAQKPADEEHPFGHGRIEYISAFIVAFIVIQVGFSLFKSSMEKILNPEELAFSVVSVGILVLSVLMKVWMAAFNRFLGNKINSSVLTATAADSLGDVLATSATILSILVFGIWKVNIDGIVGLIVSVLVMIAGVNIAKDTLAPLIGEAIDPVVCRRICEFVERYDGIIGSHDLIVHNYGPSRSMASIHAEVPNDVNIEVSHEIIDRIERDAMREMGLFLVIHMDPVEIRDEVVMAMRAMSKEVVTGLDSRLSIHDFRVVEGKESINLVFDLVVPIDYSEHMRVDVQKKIEDEIQLREKRCRCVMTIEHGFKAEE